MDQADIQAIVLIQLRQLLCREGLERRHVFVRIELGTLEHVVQVGFDKHLGARAVRRALEQEVVQPLGDQLSELKVETPVLVRLAHAAGQLKCRTLDLKELPIAAAPVAPASLETIMEETKPLIEHFEQQLAAAAVKLKSSESTSATSANQVAYYALHEQVFHCNELLKSARYRLSIDAAPRINPMQGAPEAVRRNQLSTRYVATKRFLREYMADEDLRESIAQDGADADLLALSPEALAERIRRAVRLTQVTLDNVDQPRHWLFGMESLSRPMGGYESWVQHKSQFSFCGILWACLSSHWQYDVKPIRELGDFAVVSGVAIAGLLRAIAGTYTVGGARGRDLYVLRALEIPSELVGSTEPGHELATWLSSQPVLSEMGFNPPPLGQRYPHDTIRGTIGDEVIDHASGRRLDWRPNELNEVKPWADWWVDTL